MYDLPLRCDEAPRPQATQLRVTAIEGKFQELKREVVRDFETAYILDALRRTNGNIARAAAASGKPRRVFFELMRKYGLKANGGGNADEPPGVMGVPRARQH